MGDSAHHPDDIRMPAVVFYEPDRQPLFHADRLALPTAFGVGSFLGGRGFQGG